PAHLDRGARQFDIARDVPLKQIARLRLRCGGVLGRRLSECAPACRRQGPEGNPEPEREASCASHSVLPAWRFGGPATVHSAHPASRLRVPATVRSPYQPTKTLDIGPWSNILLSSPGS